MNNLFKYNLLIKEEKTTEIEVSLSDESHPIFQAHFPNNHLLPGYLHIDIIASILNIKVLSIKKAKFIKTILPNDVVIFYNTFKENHVFVVVKKDNKKYSEFTLVV